MKTYNEIYVSFHMGRGGRFHNPGYITFLGEYDFQKLIEEDSDKLILCDTAWDDEKDEEVALDPEDWKMVDTGSNVILEGKDEIEAKKGVLEFDTIYDKDYTRTLDECNDDEWAALKRVYDDEIDRKFYLSADLQAAIKDYFCIEEAMEININALIGGIVNFNADPAAVEDEELAQAILDSIEENGYEAVTGGYDLEVAKAQLDLDESDERTVYKTDDCIFVCGSTEYNDL